MFREGPFFLILFQYSLFGRLVNGTNAIPKCINGSIGRGILHQCIIYNVILLAGSSLLSERRAMYSEFSCLFT